MGRLDSPLLSLPAPAFYGNFPKLSYVKDGLGNTGTLVTRQYGSRPAKSLTLSSRRNHRKKKLFTVSMLIV